MYKITVIYPDGQVGIMNEPDFYMLMRALDKCEIDSFKVELNISNQV